MSLFLSLSLLFPRPPLTLYPRRLGQEFFAIMLEKTRGKFLMSAMGGGGKKGKDGKDKGKDGKGKGKKK
jgi:hypothetical protein